MKSILLTCILLFSLLASAQNYRVVPAGVNCYINKDGYIKAIRLDSGIVTGSDSLYHNFATTASDSTCAPDNCSISNMPLPRSVSGLSWMGKYYGMQNNGVQYFLDSLNDTIQFLTLAQINDNWHLYTYSNGDYIEANIDSIVGNTISGSLDSVKYISLNTKDINGQLITRDFNRQTLRLSKNNGLLDVLNFRSLANDTFVSTATPIRPLTRRQIYDFNVGDIIQVRNDFNTYASNPFNGTSITTRKCLAKTIIGTDSIVYKFEATTCNLNTYYCSTDTTVNSYGHLDSLIFKGMPEEGIEEPELREYRMYSVPGRYNGSTFLISDNPWFPGHETIVGNCHYPFCAFDAGTVAYALVEGLGDLDIENRGLSGDFYKDFIYYKKDTAEWGIFYTGIGEVAMNKLPVLVAPNPTDNVTQFHIGYTSSLPVYIHITDITGMELLSQECAASNNISVNTSSLPSGVYLYRVSSGNNYANGKLVIAK